MTQETTIRLLSPPNESVTPPLQEWTWPQAGQAPVAAGDRWDDLHVVSRDRAVPRPLPFAWEASSADGNSLRYELAISPGAEFDDPLLFCDLSEPKTLVPHLHIATRYFWKVTATRAGQTVSASPVWSFITHSALPRWIKAPGITNVRDLGGWPLPGGRQVRQGMVYRGSEMNNHVFITEEGEDVLVRELGLRTDLDLRGETEDPAPALDTRKVQWVNIPVTPYGAIGDEEARESYRRLFETFADASNYPIYFHCWGGADRGGTVALLLGALLGMSREDLVRDYELTSLAIWGERSAESDDFKALLDVLASFGGRDLNQQVENYLLAAGLTEAQIAAIRAQCIVPAGDPLAEPA